MKPLLSISLPSLYPDALERTIHNIEYSTRCSYEILVVSSFMPRTSVRGGSVVWVEEKQKRGCSAAHASVWPPSSGEFIFAFTDDHLLIDGWDVIALRDFKIREKLFKSKYPGKPFSLGLRHVVTEHIGTEFGIFYPYFPMMRRHDVEMVGWYHKDYQAGFGDSDLALRVWEAGGQCDWSEEGILIVHYDDKRKYGQPIGSLQQDMQFFLSRWKPIFGKDWNTESLRDFNIDLKVSQFPQLIHSTGRTIFYNNPIFKSIVGAGDVNNACSYSQHVYE